MPNRRSPARLSIEAEVAMFALVEANVAPRCVPTRHLSRTSALYAPPASKRLARRRAHSLSVPPTTCAPAAAMMRSGVSPPCVGLGITEAANLRASDAPSPGGSPHSRRLNFSTSPAYSVNSSSDGGGERKTSASTRSASRSPSGSRTSSATTPSGTHTRVADAPCRLPESTRAPPASR